MFIGYSREDEAIEMCQLNSMVDTVFKEIIMTPIGLATKNVKIYG